MSNQDMTVLGTWKQRACALKREVYTLFLAYRDPRTPWYGKIFAALVIAYAFSPIDLIPDSIPVLGYLDDLVLVPLGVVIARRMIPSEVMLDARAKAEEVLQADRPVSWVGAVIIGAIWLTLAVLATRLLWHLFQNR